jgi:phage tail-like protein
MAIGDRFDPYRTFNFRVEIDNVGVAFFSEVSGLTFNVDPVEYREGTDKNLHNRKLTGLRKFSNLVLKRGFTEQKELWDWYLAVLNGITPRRGGAVVLCDEDHADQLRWEFQNGWICKWEGPAMKANANEVAIESIEICVERVELVR